MPYLGHMFLMVNDPLCSVYICLAGVLVYHQLPLLGAHAGSGVERIDPLNFLAGCRKRRLNQALFVLSLLALVFFEYIITVYYGHFLC